MRHAMVVGALLWCGAAMAQTPLALLRQVESSLAPGSFTALYEFTNHRLDGTVGKYRVRFQIRDADHVFGVFERPEREKGREILRVEDALWTFIPSVGRSLRIADRDSFAGGDFSNADVLRVDWSARYDVRLAKETVNQWILDLTAKPKAEATYARMRLWIGKHDTQPVQQNFYDSNGTLLKQCRYGAAQRFGAVTRPALLEMENVITGQKTVLRVLELRPGETFEATRFAVDRLGK